MKIRIKGNSLRYRLSRSEVAQFAIKGYVHEETNFGGTTLHYRLKSTTDEKLSASFIDNYITLYLPASMIPEWINTDLTGFEHDMELEGSSETLHLLVEKDFTCLENVAEDQSDNYPNPMSKDLYE
jgi:hypothetical protein